MITNTIKLFLELLNYHNETKYNEHKEYNYLLEFNKKCLNEVDKMNKNDFVGDDNINWSEHAKEAIKSGIPPYNPQLFDYFQDKIDKDAICLEIGCNVGKWTNQFLGRDWVYFGLDASKEAIEIAQNQFKNQKNVAFFYGNAVDVDKIFVSIPFDLVFFHTVLQHMHNWRKEIVLTKVNQLLEPNGFLVIQEVVDPHNCRAFSRQGWIDFVEQKGFKYICGTPDNDPRNGFLFQKIR